MPGMKTAMKKARIKSHHNAIIAREDIWTMRIKKKANRGYRTGIAMTEPVPYDIIDPSRIFISTKRPVATHGC